MSTTQYWHPRWAIRMALEDDGLKQKDLAHRLGWAESRLSKLLGGEQTMTVDDLIHIARALGRDVELLFKPPPHPEQVSPLSLDLGETAIPRYDKLEERLARLLSGFGHSGWRVAS